MIRNILLIAAALLLSGCFAYVPVPPSYEPSQGTPVRAALNRPGDYRLKDYTANDVVQIDGEVVRAGSDELVLSAFALKGASGYEFLGNGETVTVPRSDVGGLAQKKISVWRSAVLAGAVAALIGLGTFALSNVGGGGEGGDNGGAQK